MFNIQVFTKYYFLITVKFVVFCKCLKNNNYSDCLRVHIKRVPLMTKTQNGRTEIEINFAKDKHIKWWVFFRKRYTS